MWRDGFVIAERTSHIGVAGIIVLVTLILDDGVVGSDVFHLDRVGGIGVEQTPGVDMVTGKPAKVRVIIARSY